MKESRSGADPLDRLIRELPLFLAALPIGFMAYLMSGTTAFGIAGFVVWVAATLLLRLYDVRVDSFARAVWGVAQHRWPDDEEMTPEEGLRSGTAVAVMVHLGYVLVVIFFSYMGSPTGEARVDALDNVVLVLLAALLVIVAAVMVLAGFVLIFIASWFVTYAWIEIRYRGPQFLEMAVAAAVALMWTAAFTYVLLGIAAPAIQQRL